MPLPTGNWSTDALQRANGVTGAADQWRLLLDKPAAGPRNMAVDEVLADAVRAGGQPALRLYSWQPAFVSFGRNQPARGHYDAAALAAAGIGVVRRPTGGRAVLHDADLTYTVACPDRYFASPRAAYRVVNEVWVQALAAIGVGGAAVFSEARPLSLDNEPCFADPAAGEVTAAGRKLIGSAQVRLSGVLLQHGSIPLRRSATLASLPAPLAAALDGVPAYLGDLVTADRGAVVDAFLDAWREVIGPLEPRTLDAAEERRAAEVEARYSDPAWTWRR